MIHIPDGVTILTFWEQLKVVMTGLSPALGHLPSVMEVAVLLVIGITVVSILLDASAGDES